MKFILRDILVWGFHLLFVAYNNSLFTNNWFIGAYTGFLYVSCFAFFLTAVSFNSFLTRKKPPELKVIKGLDSWSQFLLKDIKTVLTPIKIIGYSVVFYYCLESLWFVLIGFGLYLTLLFRLVLIATDYASMKLDILRYWRTFTKG